MSETVIGIIGLLSLLALFLTGFEIGFAMALIGFVGFSSLVSVNAAFGLIAHDVVDTFTSYGFTVVPVFVLMGQIASNAGIARKLYSAAYRMVGHIPGGLAMATVGGATAFGSVTGSPTATAATFASVAIPEMDRYGYARKFSAGIVAASGTLGCLIPPSVPLIIYGIITEQSVGKLFLASVIPGLIISLCFVFIITGWCRMNPTLGPKGEKFGWRERITSLGETAWVGLIFIVVMGGLMKGFFTPTEAGGVGTFAVALLAFLKRDITFKNLRKALAESLLTACMVLLLLAGSIIFGHFIAVTKIPMVAADWMLHLPLNRYVIIILISLIYLLGGSFIDDLAFMILATPIFYPVITKLGFDAVWFGVFLQVVIMIGVLIPPVALNIFVVAKVTQVPMGEIYTGVTPFLLSLIFCLVLLLVFPWIALFLPSFWAL
jgi:C4-dicarboxylate transporter, DctM subunit